MGKGAKIIIAVVVVAIIAFGAWWLMKDKNKDNSAPEQNSGQNSSTNQPENSTSGQAPNTENVAATITYDGSSFMVSTTTVKSGSTVKVVNRSQDEINFDSNPHPVHTDNPELNQGDIEAGKSKTFVLTTKGTWGFHNHYNPSQKGEISVE
jgi:plastocyanin